MLSEGKWPGSLSSHVAGIVFLGNTPLLSGCLPNQSLNQAPALQEKATVKAYTTPSA